MGELYIIGYEPYHDYGYFDKSVFNNLEDAIEAVVAMPHDYYEYESITIYEIFDFVTPVAAFQVLRDNSIVPDDLHLEDSTWFQRVQNKALP